MKLLMIAPDQPGLNAIPEIRSITSLHHVTLLNGPVTLGDIYAACRTATYQGIHIASHGTEDVICLNATEQLSDEDLAQVARVAQASFVFSNACMSGRMAAYLVMHGLRYVIHTNKGIKDSAAWKMPAAFYDALQNGHGADVVGAYLAATSGDGTYGIAVDPEYVATAIHALNDHQAAAQAGRIQLTPTSIAAVAISVAVTILIIVQLIVFMAGGPK